MGNLQHLCQKFNKNFIIIHYLNLLVNAISPDFTIIIFFTLVKLL